MKNNKIKENQEQELDNIRHQIEVTKLQLELEQLKMELPIKVDKEHIAELVARRY